MKKGILYFNLDLVSNYCITGWDPEAGIKNCISFVVIIWDVILEFNYIIYPIFLILLAN